MRAKCAVQARVALPHRGGAEQLGDFIEHQAGSGKGDRRADPSEERRRECDFVVVAVGREPAVAGADGEAPGAGRGSEDGAPASGEARGEVVRVVRESRRNPPPGEPKLKLDVIHASIVRYVLGSGQGMRFSCRSRRWLCGQSEVGKMTDMAFEITAGRTFAAAHQLRLYDGSLEPLHGHNWKVRVTVAAEKLDPIGVVMDFHELQRRLDAIVSPMHNRHLNDLPAFSPDHLNPTTENVARHIAENLTLPPGVRLAGVEVWETDENSAIYRPD